MVCTGSLAATQKKTQAVRAELVEACSPRPGSIGLSWSKPVHLAPHPFGLSLSKPGCARRLADGPHAFVEGGGRESPGVRVTFFCFAKRKSPKKRRPYSLRPFASLRATCGARVQRGLARTRFTALRSDNREPLSAGRCAPRRILKGWGREHPHGPSLRSACLRSAWRLRPRVRGRATRWPVWMFGYPPPVAAPASGRLRGGMRVGARMPRALARRSCLNVAAKQRSEFCGAPRNRPDAGLPLRNAKGSQTWGRLLFGDFLLANQEKVTAPPGAHPGSRPQHRHAAQSASSRAAPGFDKLNPNGWGYGWARFRQAQPERVGADGQGFDKLSSNGSGWHRDFNKLTPRTPTQPLKTPALQTLSKT